jgi:hypothetical protein
MLAVAEKVDNSVYHKVVLKVKQLDQQKVAKLDVLWVEKLEKTMVEMKVVQRDRMMELKTAALKDLQEVDLMGKK